MGLSAHTTTDESWRGAPPFGGLRTGFAGLGGVGPRVKHEDDGGGAERTFEAMTGVPYSSAGICRTRVESRLATSGLPLSIIVDSISSRSISKTPVRPSAPS